MNTVVLVGNLASDVRLREVGEDGKKLASFLLAVSRRGGEKADFVQITAWERTAELCGEVLTKGKKVAIEGGLRSRSWEEPDGKKRSAIEVVAREVAFLSPRPE
ncbi:MAG: single-stranded DNA-binding protein [Gaiella sp.]